MHTKEEVELFLLARRDGMTVRDAAKLAGVGMGAARRRSVGDLPRSCTGRPWGSGGIGGDDARTTRGGARVETEARGLYEPPETGPLAEMTPDQIEKLLPRAVLDDLKGGGSHPLSTPMLSRRGLGGRLRLATGLPTPAVTRLPEMPRSAWCYHRARAGRAARDDGMRPLAGTAFEACGRRGCRPVWAQRRRGGAQTGERAVRRLMREMGPAAGGRRRRRRGGYAGETPQAPPNPPPRADGAHDFRAAAPDGLRVTDMTEMGHPSGARVCPNPVMGCFDGRPAGRRIDLRPSAAAADAALERACGALLPGERPCVHSDRGVRHRTASWIARRGSHGLRRSMSRKGMSCDNARAEGFFGLLKQEFYYARDWTGTTVGEFAGALDAWMGWYRSGRISQRLGWMTPDEHRAAMGYAV